MPIDTEQFLGVEFLELPTHENELSKAEDLIEKHKNRLRVIQMQRTIDDKSHDTFFNEVVRVLDYVGKLSMPAFAVEDQLEEMYAIKFKHSPQLAKKLWLDHYEVIHKPYTLLKNRCYRLLEEVDIAYFKKFNKHPPNWKI